jgi:hypothetical protein
MCTVRVCVDYVALGVGNVGQHHAPEDVEEASKQHSMVSNATQS